jgi:hypothetical protein
MPLRQVIFYSKASKTVFSAVSERAETEYFRSDTAVMAAMEA